jgi:hypothetical protein
LNGIILNVTFIKLVGEKLTERIKLKRVRSSTRKDPLINPKTLRSIGLRASKKARSRAFENGASVTIVQQGIVFRVAPDGQKEAIRTIGNEDFPRIEDDLCLG